MKKEDLKKLISQIKKYELTKEFDNPSDFDEWLSKLSIKQINNLNSLTIDPTSIMFPLGLLIDENLLECDDYCKRIDALSKLKNGDGCWHLFDRLCSPNFLKSENYYEDIEMISKAITARYALWVINEDSFIKSKYHAEDLKLIVEAKDSSEKQLDWLVAEALASVAGNIDSIKSPYHRKDMELIAKSGSDCLQMTHSFPEHSLNTLAIDPISLEDKYHLENMEILSKNPIAMDYLYKLMTNPKTIKSKNYRKEIQALLNAKSKIKATAMYYYIANPKDSEDFIDRIDLYDILHECNLSTSDIGLLNRSSRIKGNLHTNYIENLELLNNIEDEYVMYIENILTNEASFTSGHQKHDLDLLLTISNKDIFLDLFKLMTDEVSLSSPYHKADVELISKITNENKRKILLAIAMNKNSVASTNHEYDMQYILKLDLDNLDETIYKKMHYYLFSSNGINHPEHIDRLEKLSSGEIVSKEEFILKHLEELEQKIDNEDYQDELDKPIKEPNDSKKRTRKRSIFRKIFK